MNLDPTEMYEVRGALVQYLRDHPRASYEDIVRDIDHDADQVFAVCVSLVLGGHLDIHNQPGLVAFSLAAPDSRHGEGVAL